jgi:hypothetical protein
MYTGGSFTGVPQQGREADSPPSSADVKNGGLIPPFPKIFHGTGTTLLFTLEYIYTCLKKYSVWFIRYTEKILTILNVKIGTIFVFK